MLGAIIGDAIGSVYERVKIEKYELITPDSNCTENVILLLATADCLLFGGDYRESYRRWYQWYPHVKGNYGKAFSEWAQNKGANPYYSCRNDGAMRVMPVAYAFDNLKVVMEEAERAAAVTHNHPEGIKGAQATAAALFLAKAGTPKATISELLTNIFDYDLQIPYPTLQSTYRYSELAQDTVPAAIIAFLASTDFESAIQNALALGGDANTLAAITGGMAEAFYRKVPSPLQAWIGTLLDEAQQDLMTEFKAEFIPGIKQVTAA
jgi:ADP-ribosylglycohydrolase